MNKLTCPKCSGPVESVETNTSVGVIAMDGRAVYADDPDFDREAMWSTTSTPDQRITTTVLPCGDRIDGEAAIVLRASMRATA